VQINILRANILNIIHW